MCLCVFERVEHFNDFKKSFGVNFTTNFLVLDLEKDLFLGK